MDEAEFQRLLQLFPVVRCRDYSVPLSLSLCLGLQFYAFSLIFFFFISVTLH